MVNNRSQPSQSDHTIRPNPSVGNSLNFQRIIHSRDDLSIAPVVTFARLDLNQDSVEALPRARGVTFTRMAPLTDDELPKAPKLKFKKIDTPYNSPALPGETDTPPKPLDEEAKKAFNLKLVRMAKYYRENKIVDFFAEGNNLKLEESQTPDGLLVHALAYHRSSDLPMKLQEKINIPNIPPVHFFLHAIKIFILAPYPVNLLMYLEQGLSTFIKRQYLPAFFKIPLQNTEKLRYITIKNLFDKVYEVEKKDLIKAGNDYDTLLSYDLYSPIFNDFKNDIKGLERKFFAHGKHFLREENENKVEAVKYFKRAVLLNPLNLIPWLLLGYHAEAEMLKEFSKTMASFLYIGKINSKSALKIYEQNIQDPLNFWVTYICYFELAEMYQRFAISTDTYANPELDQYTKEADVYLKKFTALVEKEENEKLQKASYLAELITVNERKSREEQIKKEKAVELERERAALVAQQAAQAKDKEEARQREAEAKLRETESKKIAAEKARRQARLERKIARANAESAKIIEQKRCAEEIQKLVKADQESKFVQIEQRRCAFELRKLANEDEQSKIVMKIERRRAASERIRQQLEIMEMKFQKLEARVKEHQRCKTELQKLSEEDERSKSVMASERQRRAIELRKMSEEDKRSKQLMKEIRYQTSMQAVKLIEKSHLEKIAKLQGKSLLPLSQKYFSSCTIASTSLEQLWLLGNVIASFQKYLLYSLDIYGNLVRQFILNLNIQLKTDDIDAVTRSSYEDLSSAIKKSEQPILLEKVEHSISRHSNFSRLRFFDFDRKRNCNFEMMVCHTQNRNESHVATVDFLRNSARITFFEENKEIGLMVSDLSGKAIEHIHTNNFVFAFEINNPEDAKQRENYHRGRIRENMMLPIRYFYYTLRDGAEIKPKYLQLIKDVCREEKPNPPLFKGLEIQVKKWMDKVSLAQSRSPTFMKRFAALLDAVGLTQHLPQEALDVLQASQNQRTTSPVTTSSPRI